MLSVLVAVSGVCWRRQRCRFGHRANASDVAHALAAGTRLQVIPVTWAALLSVRLKPPHGNPPTWDRSCRLWATDFDLT